MSNHSTTLYPLTFTPVLKDYIWGGRSLETVLGRTLPKGNIAESWEIAGHRDGTTVVDNGSFAGQPLTALQEMLGLDLIGRNSQWAHERGKFPLLIKLLDAHAELSVQVHPNDAYALANEGNELGKTEMWVVLHAAPDAAIILGVTPGTTPERFKAGVAQGQLEPFLHRIPVKAGDVVCVPAGSLHAILSGLIIAEIQQNSNTTYRVYDWGRNGRDGKPRSLHIEEALRVIRWRDAHPSLAEPAKAASLNGVLLQRILACAYFVVERIDLAARGLFRNSGAGFHTLFVESGTVAIEGGGVSEALSRGTSCLLPAALELYTIEPAQGKAAVIRTSLPE